MQLVVPAPLKQNISRLSLQVMQKSVHDEYRATL